MVAVVVVVEVHVLSTVAVVLLDVVFLDGIVVLSVLSPSFVG